MTFFLAGTIGLHHKHFDFGKLFLTISLSQHDLALKAKYGNEIKNLKYHYQDKTGKCRSGIKLIDPLNKQTAKQLFT